MVMMKTVGVPPHAPVSNGGSYYRWEMAGSCWPVTCRPAYPGHTPASKPLVIYIWRPHTYQSVPLFLCSNFLSQIVVCLPLYPYTISCIVLSLPVCESTCLAVLKAVIHWAWPLPGGIAPQDQWERLIEYIRYELHAILRQTEEKWWKESSSNTLSVTASSPWHGAARAFTANVHA